VREQSLVTSDDKGIYCPPGDFHIDPWGKTKIAIITHAHSDHLRLGSGTYICTSPSRGLIEHRLRNTDSPYVIKSYDYDETFQLNGVSVSFHPAGHILGSAQIRLEYGGKVVVLTGDYKRHNDPTCQSFVQLSADILVTEATFGLPIYQWPDPQLEFDKLYHWILRNKEEHSASILFGYSLGKAQRILAELHKRTDEVIFIHGAIHDITEIYRDEGIDLPQTQFVVEQDDHFDFSDRIVISPPSAFRSNYMNRFKQFNSAFTSGWMRVRGRRRMGGYDTGFVVSDHADWNSLIDTVIRSQANEVYVGFTKNPTFVRYLREELGYETRQLDVKFTGEDD